MKLCQIIYIYLSVADQIQMIRELKGYSSYMANKKTDKSDFMDAQLLLRIEWTYIRKTVIRYINDQWNRWSDSSPD